MKICFSTIGCPEWHWADIIAMARDLRYDGIEVRGVRNELFAPSFKYFLPDRIDETLERLRELNLSIPCLTTGCELQLPHLRQQNLAEMKQYIDLAKKLGTPYIRVLGDGVTAPHADIDAALVRELCIEAGAYAADSGVTLLLETNGYFADTIRLRQLLREIGMPSVQALWDVHHPYRFLDEPPEQTLENLGDHIRHVHLKDSLFQDGKVRYRMLGQGDIPARRCVELLDAAGYDGFYSLEWVRRWDLSLEEPGIAFAHFAAAFGR